MRGKKIVTVTTLLLLLGSLAACGVRQESTANDKAEIQLEAEDAIKGTDSQSSQELRPKAPVGENRYQLIQDSSRDTEQQFDTGGRLLRVLYQFHQ